IKKVERGKAGPDEDGIAAGLLEGAGGDQCGQPRADDRDVGLHRGASPSPTVSNARLALRPLSGGPAGRGSGGGRSWSWRSTLKSSRCTPAVTCAWRSWLPQKT